MMGYFQLPITFCSGCRVTESVVGISMAVVCALLKLALTVLLCLHAPQPTSALRFCGFIHVSVVMSIFLLRCSSFDCRSNTIRYTFPLACLQKVTSCFVNSFLGQNVCKDEKFTFCLYCAVGTSLKK